LISGLGDPKVAQTVDAFGQMYRWGIVAVYSSLIGFAIVVQGGVAAYYMSRRKHVRAFVASTPDWVVEVMRRPR
jgi:hypothetical protein